MVAETIVNSTFENEVLTKGPASWLDIFFGVLVSPIKTFSVIRNINLHPPKLSAVMGSMLTVIIAALADSCTSSASSISGWAINCFVYVISMGLFCWLAFSLFMRLLATLTKTEISTRSCLIVTGWAFSPLIFKAPAACFSNATMVGDIFSLVVSVWFSILIIFAFDAVLNLGKWKTTVFVFFLPLCLFFSYSIALGFMVKIIFDGFL